MAAAAAPSAPAKAPSRITTLYQLVQATHDAYLSRDSADHVEEVEVIGAGRRLSCWPPLLSSFSNVKKIVLRGHFVTCLPSSLGDLRQLEVLAVTNGTLLSIPQEMAGMAALRDLDLSKNELTVFPHQLCCLTGLTALNLMGNKLKALPEGFGGLQGLQKLGLKSNALSQLPDSFTRLTNLVELFLTDNRLSALPEGFGALQSLVKLQASFNPWASLPADLLALPRLELFRLAAGALPAWPGGGGEGDGAGAPPLPPALAWCSLGGNPAAGPLPAIRGLRALDISDINTDRKNPLGEGASGECFRATVDGEAVALKVFLAEVSPDGKAQDEVAISCTLDHPNITKVLALVFNRRNPWRLEAGAAPPAAPTANGAAPAGNGAAAANGTANGAANGDGGGEGPYGDGEHQRELARGMVLELVKGKPLAAKPTSQHLLRCKWAEGTSFTLESALAICSGLASALAYLHGRRICHGDVYAHNVLYCPQAQRAVLCDFGASFCYREGEEYWELMEVRAFGLFMADIVERLDAASAASPAAERLRRLAARCSAVGAEGRPRFAEVEEELRLAAAEA